jgi:anti-anti-sigma factor
VGEVKPGLTIEVDQGKMRALGELDVATAPILLIALSRLEEDARVLDLEEVSFMDSSGLRALITAHRRYPHLVFTHPSAAVRRLLDVSGVAPLLLGASVA